MKKSKYLATNGIIAALLVLLNMINPIGYGMLQLRVGDYLVLGTFYNEKTFMGILIGTMISNLFSPLGVIDVFAGATCTIVGFVIYRMVGNVWLKGLINTIVISLVIGTEISWVFNVPLFASIFAIFVSTAFINITGIQIIENVPRLKSFIKTI